jgi:hypothetical protein
VTDSPPFFKRHMMRDTCDILVSERTVLRRILPLLHYRNSITKETSILVNLVASKEATIHGISNGQNSQKDGKGLFSNELP